MSVFRRIGNAARGLRAGWTYPVKVSQGRVSRTPRARSILLWPEYMNQQAQWVMHDLSSYARDGFEINAVIYSAIMFKVRTAFGCLLRAYRGTRDEPELLPAGNELSNLLDRPNPHQSYAELQADMLTFFNLFGDAYVWFKRRAGLEFPERFYTLRPDRVVHLYDTGELKGFLFVPEGMAIEDGVLLLPEDTMHVKLPNPLDPYMGLGKGLSPIASMARSGDVDNAATEFLKLFFDQGTMPMSMITTDMPLIDEDIAEARERWMMQYGNWANWIAPIIMGSGAKYQKIGATLGELDLGRLDARNESRMVMPFGVPLNLIESRPELVQSTYSNKETDYKSFLTNTLIPELQMFETEWRFFLRSENGKRFAQYDYKGIPGWFNKREFIADVAAAWTASAVTRAEYRQAIGLPVTEADEVYQVPVMVQFVPVGELPAPPAPPTLPPPEETPPPEQAPEGEEETETGAAGAEETATEETKRKRLKYDPHQPRDETGRWGSGGGGGSGWGDATDFGKTGLDDEEGIMAAADWAYKGWDDWHTSIDRYEEEGFSMYADDFGYKDINRFARHGESINMPDDEAEGYIMVMDRALARAAAPANMVVYRGFGNWKGFDKLEEGATFSDKAYVSTSLIQEVAQNFGTNYAEIRVPEGFPCGFMGGMGVKVETEILFPRNTTFRVVSRSGNHAILEPVR